MKERVFPAVGKRSSLLLSLVSCGVWVAIGLSCARSSAQQAGPQKKGSGAMAAKPLPAANVEGRPILQTLRQRQTSREFSTKPIDNQLLSDLLWAAYGVNRSDGKRTAPSAHDWQYIDIYVSDSSGLYRFEAKRHELVLVRSGDIRSKTGLQDFVSIAPVSLIYVSDGRKFPRDVSGHDRLLFGASTTGAIAQNVYLFCAANNLNTGVRADIDRATLSAAMSLSPEQHILLAQSVGYPPGTK